MQYMIKTCLNNSGFLNRQTQGLPCFALVKDCDQTSHQGSLTIFLVAAVYDTHTVHIDINIYIYLYQTDLICTYTAHTQAFV